MLVTDASIDDRNASDDKEEKRQSVPPTGNTHTATLQHYNTIMI
jgi:hypothetical protein